MVSYSPQGLSITLLSELSGLQSRRSTDSVLAVQAMAGCDEEADLSETFKNQLKGMLVCYTCGPFHRFCSGKTHKSRSKHPMRPLTPEERAEEVAWYREIQADGEVARLRQLDLKRRESRQARASSSTDVVAASEPASEQAGEYRFDFGKNKGKALSHIWRSSPSYLAHLVNQKGFLETKITLARAMEKAGIMAEAQAMASQMKTRLAERTLAREAAGEVGELHPEVARLRAIQVEEAREALGKGAPDVIAPLPSLKRKRRVSCRAPRKSKGSRGGHSLQHCWVCGSIDHKTTTCPDKPEAVKLRALENQLVARARENNKRKMRLVTHLKYINLNQRSASYEGRPAQCSHVRPSRTLKEMLRMDALAFTKCCIEGSLLANLEGAPCILPGCFNGCDEPGAKRRLGHLSGSKAAGELDVKSQSVFYRCRQCHGKYTVTFGSSLFSKVGGGAASLTDNVVGFWNCVHDVPLTTCCKMLGLSEAVVRGFYDTARGIMAAAALRKQGAIVFGELPDNKTCDFEPDESSFFSWSEDEGDQRAYHYWVWLGVYQRGSPEKLWLKESGVHSSHGEGRLPPLEIQHWRDVCSEIFNEKSNMVCMSDSAVAYTTKPWPVGVVDAHHVNHSQKPRAEFARSVEALADVVTGERRPAIASTCLIDPTWRRLKAELPRGSVTAKTEVGRRRMASYIRAGQWKVMLSTYERWGPFCEAASVYEAELNKKKEQVLPTLHACASAVEKRARRTRARTCAEGKGPPMSMVETHEPHGPAQPAIVVLAECPEPLAGNVQATPSQVQEDVVPLQPMQAPEDVLRQQSIEAWGERYFEAQAPGGKCGQHALNNLLGVQQFNDDFLAGACQFVLQELPGESERLHKRGAGWYSHSVLAQALSSTMPPVWRLVLRPAAPTDWQDVASMDDVAGVLCNVRNVHWTCITKHAGQVFYVDSCHLPVLIDFEAFTSILDAHPMSFMVVRQDSRF